MNPVIPAPFPVPLPAPSWLLQLLLVFTLVLHLLPMNLLLGGSVLLSVSSFLGRRVPQHRELARRASQAMPPVAAFTITLGIAPLLFLQLVYGQFFYTSSVLMAWSWLAVVLFILLAYYGIYWFNAQQDELGPRAFWVMLATAMLFLLVSAIFTQNMTLMLHPQQFYSLFFAGSVGNYVGAFDAATLARWLHFTVAALAVAGLGLAWLSGGWEQEAPELASWARRYGMKWFMVGTGFQFLVGLGFLFTLPPQVRGLFLGGDRLATAVLALAIVLAVLALAAAPRSLPAASVAIVGTIGLMSVIRHLVRVASLQPYFDPRALPVSGQWPVFALFVVLLLAGLGTLGWMLRAFFRPTGVSSVGSQ